MSPIFWIEVSCQSVNLLSRHATGVIGGLAQRFHVPVNGVDVLLDMLDVAQ